MVHDSVADTRVVAVNGARQVGKSTLVKAVLRSYPDSTERSLDVATERQAALSDLVGIEVKAAETVHRRDFAGLRHLQSRLGDRFHFGLVLHAGTTFASFGDRLAAAPIDLLWQ